MHKFILYFCSVAVLLAIASPFPYESLNTDFDHTNLYNDVPNSFFAPLPEQPIPEPDTSSTELLAQADGDEGGSSSSGPQLTSQVFCNSGYLRACCSYTPIGRTDKETGHKMYFCMSIARGEFLLLFPFLP